MPSKLFTFEKNEIRGFQFNNNLELHAYFTCTAIVLSLCDRKNHKSKSCISPTPGFTVGRYLTNCVKLSHKNRVDSIINKAISISVLTINHSIISSLLESKVKWWSLKYSLCTGCCRSVTPSRCS